MERIRDILAQPTPYSGSEVTAQLVRAELEKRYGPKVAAEYQPKFNTRTYKDWLNCGYKVKKGEKALPSFVILTERDKHNNIISRHPRKISLFHQIQVEKL